METIVENFEEILREKQIPLAKSVAETGETFYTGNFQVTTEKVVPFSVAFQTKESISDVQILYSKLSYVKDFQKKAEVLALINQLNEDESSYYRVCLAEDGEVYLRLLTRITNAVQPIYEMLITGSSVVKKVLDQLVLIGH
ncbi:hypothetical protein ACWOFR_06555 [Carnobacterium gallinarum]|uniref:hypothetical protein n=1 Tax=Carnobacterium gallinarum TaxID=2749 RepID=UPI000550B032|nr:hypothetical protein [Carnobacterium gallinarum]